MRTLGWLAALASCMGCGKRVPPVVTPRAKPVSPRVLAAPQPPTWSPSDVLSKLHWTDVSVDESLELPDGVLIGYTFDLASSLIGEHTAEGDDVQADIETAEAACEARIEALSEDDRAYHDTFEDRGCSEIAIADVLGDEALALDCGQTGLAYFDREGNLHTQELIGSACTDGFDAFDVHKLGPDADATLWVAVTSHGDVGTFDRGGWGFRTDASDLYVLDLPRAGDDAELETIAKFMLDHYREGGNCGGGFRGAVWLDEDGVLEYLEREYNECDGEGCIPAERVEAYREEFDLGPDDPLDTDVCDPREVGAERYRWNGATRAWEDIEWVGDVPKELPDGSDY